MRTKLWSIITRPVRWASRGQSLIRLGLLSISLFGSACGGSDAALAPPIEDQSRLYWDITVNYPAVLLSLTDPYDTLQLHAIPRNALGKPFITDTTAASDVRPATWVSRDSSKVRVSETGRLISVAEIDRVFIIVSQQVGSVTRQDSVLVSVKDDPTHRVLTTFEVRPLDSLKRASGSGGSIDIVALDQMGDPMEELPFQIVPQDSSIAKIGPWASPGNTWDFSIVKAVAQTKVTAVTWVYGVVKTDSFTLETGGALFTLPAGIVSQWVDKTGKVGFLCLIGCSSVEMGPGGVTSWSNLSGAGPDNAMGGVARVGEVMDVIFDDSTAPQPALLAFQNSGGGNIYAIPFDTTIAPVKRARYRRFTKPGTYPYTIKPFGYRGTVVVLDR